jgi:hypothetical protein
MEEMFVHTMASSVCLNDEAGINVLTLESIALLLKRALNHLRSTSATALESRELKFLDGLPPSFFMQITSLGYLVPPDPLAPDDLILHTIRSACHLLRHISSPLLVLVSVVYVVRNTHLCGMLMVLYVVWLFCAVDIRMSSC